MEIALLQSIKSICFVCFIFILWRPITLRFWISPLYPGGTMWRKRSKLSFVQLMAWHQTGVKPLTELGDHFYFRKMHLNISSGNWRPFCAIVCIFALRCIIFFMGISFEILDQPGSLTVRSWDTYCYYINFMRRMITPWMECKSLGEA